MPAERVQPLKHKDLGELIVEWAKNPGSRPATNDNGEILDVDQFRKDVAHLVKIPEQIKRIVFVQPLKTGAEEFEYYIRLPLEELVMTSVQKAKDHDVSAQNDTDDPYPVPDFYEIFLNTAPDDRNHEAMLYRRIADYTFAHCH